MAAGDKKQKGRAARVEATQDGLALARLEEGLRALQGLPDASADVCLTDPPYGIDQLGLGWSADKIKKSQTKAGAMGGLPVGMKFDSAQGAALQEFLTPFFKEVYRVLKPGGFILCFSQARLYHRAAMAVELAGFEMRDMLGWVYEGQAKAFTQDHFVKKMGVSEERKAAILKSLAGRKTPQLKPMIEPIALGQKPREGTFVENWMSHGVGLIDVSHPWEGKFPGNLISCPKPGPAERGAGNSHPTVKPLALLEQLIKVFAPVGGVVIDPFAGSGSTLLAARALGRKGWGAELDPLYFKIIAQRLKAQTQELESARASLAAAAKGSPPKPATGARASGAIVAPAKSSRAINKAPASARGKGLGNRRAAGLDDVE